MMMELMRPDAPYFINLLCLLMPDNFTRQRESAVTELSEALKIGEGQRWRLSALPRFVNV